MSSAISKGLRSPLRSIIKLRQNTKQISTSSVLNETILVKNNEEFVTKVLNNDKPVIVNFHADWCDPCKILTPKLKELIEPLDDLDLAVVDVEENAELVHTFEVKAVPAVIAISNGLVVDKFIGVPILGRRNPSRITSLSVGPTIETQQTEQQEEGRSVSRPSGASRATLGHLPSGQIDDRPKPRDGQQRPPEYSVPNTAIIHPPAKRQVVIMPKPPLCGRSMSSSGLLRLRMIKVY